MWHILAIMAVGCLSLAVLLVAWRTSPISRSLRLGTLILFVGNVAFNYLITIYEATLEPRKAALYASVRAVGRLGLSLVLLLLVARSAVSPVTAGALAYLFVVVHMLRDLGFASHLRCLGDSFSVHLLRRLLAYGFPLAGWSLMQQVLGAFDRFIIAYYRGSAEVGIYSSNYRLVRGALSLVAAPVLMAAHPLIINVWEQTRNRRKVESLIALASKYYLMIAFPIVAYVAIMSREVASAFLGPQYREGAVIIPIVLIGFMTSGLSLYVQKGLEIARRTERMFVAALACAVVSTVSNLVLVPRHGYRGAAVTTALSYSLYLLLVYLASRGFLEWTVSRRSLVNVLVATVALSSVALALRIRFRSVAPLWTLLLTGIPSLAAYLGSLFLLGELRGEVSLAKESVLQHLRSR